MEAPDPGFAERVRELALAQPLLATIGAILTRVEPGEVEIELPFRADLTQQTGFLHAGIVTAMVDTACGAAAYSLMPAGSGVLSVEFKVNLLAPAVGRSLRAIGRVVRAGRTITVCQGEAYAVDDGRETAVATMLATMIRRG